MNTDEGMFEELAIDMPTGAKVLAVGEVVQIKGNDLRVVEIKERRVTLELMSIDDRLTATEVLMNRHDKRAAAAIARKLGIEVP